MTAATLLQELTGAGIRITANADRLHVEAPVATVTPELRKRLADHKAELLPLIHVRDHLLTLARSLGFPDSLVLELPESELVATAGQYADLTNEKGEELGRRLLVFYLRSVAGIEPALGDVLK